MSTSFTFLQATQISYEVDQHGRVFHIGIHPLDGPEIPEEIAGSLEPEVEALNDWYATVLKAAEARPENKSISWGTHLTDDGMPPGVDWDPV